MKKGEHTPGPWRCGQWGDADTGEREPFFRIGCREDGWGAVCTVRNEADARLIAAAPDLLAACEWALSMMAGGRPEEDIAHLRAAIKKARGTP